MHRHHRPHLPDHALDDGLGEVSVLRRHASAFGMEQADDSTQVVRGALVEQSRASLLVEVWRLNVQQLSDSIEFVHMMSLTSLPHRSKHSMLSPLYVLTEFPAIQGRHKR